MVERKFLLFMPEYTSLIMYGIFFLALVFFYIGIRSHLTNFNVSLKELLVSLWERATANSKSSTANFIRHMLLQHKLRENNFVTLLHIPIFIGFILLLIGTAIVFIDEDILFIFGGFKILRGAIYKAYEFILDTAGLVLLLGLVVALYRRLVTKPSHLHTKMSDYFVIFLLLVIVLSGFIAEGLRLNLDPVPYSGFSYFGYLISISLFSNVNTNPAFYVFIWYVHLILAMTFIAAIPFTKLRHLFLIPVNLLLFPPKEYGDKAKLDTPFNILEIDEELEGGSDALDSVGVGTIERFGWDERLQIFSCTNCGRCEENCPAHNSGRLLSPRNVIQKLGDQITSTDKSNKLFDEIIHQEEMWGCTNCYACIEVCPSFIQHVGHFLNFRRFILNDEFEDDTKISILGNVERNGNPYGLPSYARTEWLEDHEVSAVTDIDEYEYLYFIGCSSCYDQRCQKIVESLIKILNHAQIRFAILGEEERCCGEPAKRMGEEGLFQMTAVQNIELFETFGVRKILVHCPHCYNTLKYEYNDFQGNYDVIHHSELIFDLIQDNRIRIVKNNLQETITFHDPCNLGRLNGIYDPPRSILSQYGNLKEMDRCMEKSFCCGGGGCNSFYSINEKKRISQIRLEEALKLEIQMIGVSCPFCMTMFEDVKGNLPKDLQIPRILDIAEVVSLGLDENKTQ